MKPQGNAFRHRDDLGSSLSGIGRDLALMVTGSERPSSRVSERGSFGWHHLGSAGPHVLLVGTLSSLV